MKDHKENRIGDEDLTKVDGGILPLGWQAVISGGIKQFKDTPESEITALGYTKDVNGMINYLLNSGLVQQFNLNDKEIETVRQFIINNY